MIITVIITFPLVCINLYCCDVGSADNVTLQVLEQRIHARTENKFRVLDLRNTKGRDYFFFSTFFFFFLCLVKCLKNVDTQF